MSKPSPILGRDLGQAICKHFGIDTTKHTVDSDFEIKTEPGKPVTVTLTFMLTADDLAGIARAAGADDGEQGPDLVNLDPPNRLYMGDETRDILRRYAAGTKAETQALTIKVDASEAAALIKEAVDDLAATIRSELRKGVETMLDLAVRMHAEQRATVAELVPGEALAIEPDPRLDEIVSLLKQLVQAVERKDFLGRDMGLPVRIVAAGGGSSGSTCECQRGSNPIPQPRPVL